MNSVTESNHHEDLTGTGAGTISRVEHLITDFTQSGHEVVISAPVPVVYLLDGIGDGALVGVVVEVEFDVRTIAEGHHANLCLLWSDLKSPADVD